MGGRREQCLVLGATLLSLALSATFFLPPSQVLSAPSSSIPRHTCGCRIPDSDDPVMNCALARRFVLLLSLALYACFGTVTTSNSPHLHLPFLLPASLFTYHPDRLAPPPPHRRHPIVSASSLVLHISTLLFLHIVAGRRSGAVYLWLSLGVRAPAAVRLAVRPFSFVVCLGLSRYNP